MLSEFAHPTCFIQCLISAIMISFLGFHLFPLDRYDMKEILQVKDSAVLQVTVIKPLHLKKKKKNMRFNVICVYLMDSRKNKVYLNSQTILRRFSNYYKTNMH